MVLPPNSPPVRRAGRASVLTPRARRCQAQRRVAGRVHEAYALGAQGSPPAVDRPAHGHLDQPTRLAAVRPVAASRPGRTRLGGGTLTSGTELVSMVEVPGTARCLQAAQSAGERQLGHPGARGCPERRQHGRARPAGNDDGGDFARRVRTAPPVLSRPDARHCRYAAGPPGGSAVGRGRAGTQTWACGGRAGGRRGVGLLRRLDGNAGREDEPVEMDRTYQYYNTVPIELSAQPSIDKQYSTLYVSEDGKDVMILRNISGRYGWGCLRRASVQRRPFAWADRSAPWPCWAAVTVKHGQAHRHCGHRRETD